MQAMSGMNFFWFSGAVKPHRHSMTQTPAPRLHQNLPDVVPPLCHGHNHSHHGHSHNHAHNHAHSHADHSHGGKRVPCGGSGKPGCRKSFFKHESKDYCTLFVIITRKITLEKKYLLPGAVQFPMVFPISNTCILVGTKYQFSFVAFQDLQRIRCSMKPSLFSPFAFNFT